MHVALDHPEKSGAHGVAARCEELRGRCLGYYDSPASASSKAKGEEVSPSELKPAKPSGDERIGKVIELRQPGD